MNRTKGLFITFEGGDGSGKSTILARTADWLSELGHDVVTTREPGGIDIAEQIRAVLLNPQNKRMDSRTEALLYTAARRQHLVEKVVPALLAGRVVLCDRFVDSSLAYQGIARGIGLDDVWMINQFAVEGCMPDLTFFLDVEPERGLERIRQNREREVNRLDMETLQFHQRVRDGYRQVIARFPERIVVIDANRSVDEVFADVQEILQQRLSDRSLS